MLTEFCPLFIRNSNSGSTGFINNCTFSANVSGAFGGGAIMNATGNYTISNCSMYTNTSGIGGAIYIGAGNTTLTNCNLVSNNTTSITLNASGAGIYAAGGNLVATNCTFYNNIALGSTSQGGGLYCAAGAGGTLKNCILWANTTPSNTANPNREEIFKAGTTATLSVSNSIIRDYSAVGTTSVSFGTGISTSNPLFVNTTNLIGSDNIWATADDGLQLQCTSPAINAGDPSVVSPTTDITGISRQGIFDLGAYEQNALNISLATSSISATLNQVGNTVYSTCTALIAKVNTTNTGTISASGNTSASVWIESSSSNFVRRHYEITPATDGAAQVTLYFTQADFDDFNLVNTTKLPTGPSDITNKANLIFEKRSGISNDGTGLPNTYSTTPINIDPADSNIVWNTNSNRWEVTFDVTGFSGFFAKTTTVNLPLTLISFTGTKQNNSNLLQWETATETNTSHFELENSTDALNFTKIATVQAMGNSNSNHEYYYIDNNTYNNYVYYRLKMIDVDGSYTYSNIVSLLDDQKSLVVVYPNPTNGMITIKNDVINTEAILRDVYGRLMQKVIISSNIEQIDMTNLVNGIYILSLDDGTYIKIIKR